MCMDVCRAMCTDMCVDMCMSERASERVCARACMHMYTVHACVQAQRPICTDLLELSVGVVIVVELAALL